MKYELNVPYTFPVVGCHYDDGHKLILEVQINSDTFSVYGYEPQILNGMPKEIQCRILRDPNGEAYLRQDVEPLFPLLYSDGHKHLLEVVDLLDQKTIKVRDKYGISHQLKVDNGNDFSIHELITRNVSVSSSNSITFIEDCSETIHSVLAENNHGEVSDCTIIDINDGRDKVATSEPAQPKQRTLTELIKSGNIIEIESYIGEFNGPKIRLLHSEIKNYIENECIDGREYCQLLSILFKYNAALFLGAVASADSSHIQYTSNCINILDSFLPKMLDAQDKIHHALKIIGSFRDKLSEAQKHLISTKAAYLNRPELYDLLFYALDADSNFSVEYLMNTANGIAAKYALYTFYLSVKNRGQLRTTTPIEALRISSVRRTAETLAKGDEIEKCVSALIYRNILGYETKIDNRLIRAVEDNGFDGFKFHFKNISSQKQHEQAYSDLIVRRQEYEFKPLRRLDNHYLLFHLPSNSYALLPISLTERPISISHPKPVKAFVYKKYGDLKLLLVYQKKQSFFFRQPPIVEQKTKLNIHFSHIGGKWLPVVDSYAKFIKIKILNMQAIDDFKAKYVVSITKAVDFLTYNAIIVEKL